MVPVTLRAFAKINLSLRVRERRADGFHDVQTILQAIDLCDRVTCERRRGPFEIRCDTPGVPTDRTNLVWQAAQRLWQAAGRAGEPRDAVVTLRKRIPMRAGLGGGSSNAAAALAGLNRVWRCRMADDRVRAIAAEIGSDVPYFLVGGAALGLGRGEEIYPLPHLPRLWVVLALPDFGVATRDAYAWLDAWRAEAGQQAVPAAPSHLAGTWLGGTVPLVNDLEPPVVERHPVVGELAGRLRRLGAVMAAMSGSGSAVFGVFRSDQAAGRAARQLGRSGVDVRRARFVRRRGP